MLAPLLVWLAAFVVAPTAILVGYSLGRRGELGGVVFDWTLASYARVLDPTILRIAVRSVVYAGVTTAICVAIGYPVAWCVARARPERRDALLLLVTIPFWTSFLIRTYAWVTILKSEGLLNGALLALGAIAQPIEMLYTPGAVVVGLVYTFLPFMILPIYASVEKLDPSLLEAALDLGATPAAAVRRIALPLTAPGIAAGLLFVFVPALGLFAVNDVLGGGRVDMIGNVIENQFKGSARDWPFGAALGVTLLAAFGAAYWLARRRERLA